MKKLLTFLTAFFVSLTISAADPAHVRVLSIGNSFSRDAFAYVPFLMEELAPGTQVDFGILYIGGCRLKRHYENLVGEKEAYEFDFYQSQTGHWTMEPNVSIQQGLAKQEWDIVILQQQSADSRYYSTYQPWLDSLLAYIHEVRPQATAAWLLTQAYGTGYKHLGDMSMDEMWARVDASSQQVIDETSASIIIPAGTAIQNARYTSLDRLGKSGHLVNDGFHLQEGIPVLIEGLVTTAVVMKHYGIEVDVQKSTIEPTLEWTRQRHTPQPNGEPEEATPEEYQMARQCAQWAIDAPWQLTVIEPGIHAEKP